MKRDSISNTFTVAFTLCVVCSVLVSTAAVGLRPYEKINAERERKKNILVAAGLYDEKVTIEDAFSQVETRLVNLDSGSYVELSEDEINSYDQRKAARDPEKSVAIAQEP